MSNSKEVSLKKVYGLFLLSIITICLLYVVCILFLESIFINTVVFVISILISATIFLYVIRKKVSNTYLSLDSMIDDAINKEIMDIKYDETILSSLEVKMLKYIKLTKSNKEAIEKERNKVKTLVSDISHQTKTPISNILLFSQLALENKSIDNSTKEALLDISKQSERLDFLIKSLIKMSRLESGIISPNIDNTKLIDTITKSVQKIYINADKKDINITVDCEESLTAVHDSKWTIEALVNILENAVKYTDSGGYISISAISYELFVRVDIQDNGIGIEEDEINNIFKRFYRSKNVNKYEGVGIGLYLAREIISSQGGYIKVKSELRKGSTFSVFLPINIS